MKILIVNDKLICGGAEIYCDNLKYMLKQNHEVHRLCFDEEFEVSLKNYKEKETFHNVKVKGKYNKFIFNPLIFFKIKKIIQQINPDVILLNNIFATPKTQIKALRGYKIIKIVHDYSVVCPKSTCIFSDYQICEGYKYNNCYKKCEYHDSKLQLILKRHLTKKMEVLNKKYVTKFISPSECLNSYLSKYDYASLTINNPIKMSNFHFDDKQKKYDYIYVGTINERKGIYHFLDAFLEFVKDKDLNMILIGPKMENRIDAYLEKCDKIKYLGALPNDKALSYIAKSKFVVVPSLWMENYPTTVLEGMLTKTFVIGSNRGGIPEMVKEGKGLTFDILDKEDIISKLEMTQKITEKEYSQMIEKAYNDTMKNNSFDTYKEKIEKVLMEVTK